jgi:hypothetical protein
MLAVLLAVRCAFNPDPAAAWTFAVAGDSRGGTNGVNTQILGEIAGQMAADRPDFVLFTGDLVTGYTNEATFRTQLLQWRSTMAPLYDAGIAVYPVRGNHEFTVVVGGVQAWNDVFSGPYALPVNGPDGEVGLTYSFTHNNAFIVGLDQYANHPIDVNQAWLDRQLSLNDRRQHPHVFAFAHEPAFKVGPRPGMEQYPVQRNAFWNSLKNAGARAFFNAHDHFYSHLELRDNPDDGNPDNDVHQFTLGTAGAPFYEFGLDGDMGTWTPVDVHHEAQYGYLLVSVEGDTVTTTWRHRVVDEQDGVSYPAGPDVFQYTVPEPGALALLTVGAAGLLVRAWRSRRKQPLDRLPSLSKCAGRTWSLSQNGDRHLAISDFLWNNSWLARSQSPFWDRLLEVHPTNPASDKSGRAGRGFISTAPARQVPPFLTFRP